MTDDMILEPFVNLLQRAKSESIVHRNIEILQVALAILHQASIHLILLVETIYGAEHIRVPGNIRGNILTGRSSLSSGSPCCLWSMIVLTDYLTLMTLQVPKGSKPACPFLVYDITGFISSVRFHSIKGTNASRLLICANPGHAILQHGSPTRLIKDITAARSNIQREELTYTVKD